MFCIGRQKEIERPAVLDLLRQDRRRPEAEDRMNARLGFKLRAQRLAHIGQIRSRGDGDRLLRSCEQKARRQKNYLSVTRCTRQLPTSPRYRVFGLRQSISFTVPNSFGPFPAVPNFPITVPFSSIL